MSAESLVRLRGVAKRFPRTAQSGDRLRSLFALLRGAKDQNAIEVLRDIDLDVQRGQSVAIIGENGAGKSTLLKILTGVMSASEGSVAVNGSVGALLELGAGFQPDRSGMENLKLNAALLGLSEREIRERTEQITEFADLGEYIHEPVKHYSSGMVVRLGFAVVAAVRPDLLVTDEVLAVGDESFQKKCVRWIESYLQDGGTLLLVSHSMYHVQRLCQRAYWLNDGTVERGGDVFDVTRSYLAWHERKSAEEKQAPIAEGEGYRVLSVTLQNDPGLEHVSVGPGADLRIDVEVYSGDGRPPGVSIGLIRADGTPIHGFTSVMEGVSPRKTGEGRFTYRMVFERLPLLPGSYSVSAHAMDPECARLFDLVSRSFEMTGDDPSFGLCRLEHRWLE